MVEYTSRNTDGGDMTFDEPVWERFLSSKLTQTSEQGGANVILTGGGTQGSASGFLDNRSVNLTAGSIANSDAVLVRELAMNPTSELFADKALSELTRRGRFVDFVRAVMSSVAVAPASGRQKKAQVAVRCIEAMHASLVVDKPARDLLGVLLAELDDIDTDHVPLVVDSILSPLLRASRQRPGSTAIGEVTDGGMGEAAATGFLIALELLPKVLGLTAGVAALGQAPPVPELVQGLSGTQYKERIVLRLFRAHWPGSVSIGICQALRDLDLGERQLRVAVDRVLRHLRKRAELHDLPPLTYQLLLLAGRVCKEAALEGVIRVFDRLDAAAEAADREVANAADGHIPMRRSGDRLGASSTAELRLVEGTILLHFNFAMKQDHSLANCLLKGFQRRAAAPEIGRAFTPFRVALLLSMARIQRFGQPVLDLVQDILTDCLAYDHFREGSAWLEVEEELARGARQPAPAPAGQSRQTGNQASDAEGPGCGLTNPSAGVVEKVLLTVVKSSRGWDHLVGSLLKLGLQLLDRGVAGAGTGASSGSVAKGMLENLHESQSQRAALRASRLGRVVLMETFKTHEIVRHQVLTSVLEQVTARSQCVMGYVKLLGLLAERNPNLLLDEAEAVRDVFGYISVLPPPVAERFLRAVAPLLRLRPRLQDSVVLPLRKALFSREERARLVAVGGLVLLLGLQKRSGFQSGAVRGEAYHGGTQLSQASQTSMSQESMMISSANGGVAGFSAGGGGDCSLSLAEGFGLLRRCLTQQLVVRARLYDGLMAAFDRGSLELQLDTVSLLVGHLRRYVNVPAADGATDSGRGSGQLILLLKRCLDPQCGDIVEPLPLLIGCLHRILVSGKGSLAAHEDALADERTSGSQEVGGKGDVIVENGNRVSSVGAESSAALEALRESLDELDCDLRRLSTAVSEADLEDFGLDKVADFSPVGGAVSRGNLAAAALLCGSYEALMQGALLLSDRRSARSLTQQSKSQSRLPSASAVRGLLSLFDRRQALVDLVRPSLPTAAQQRGSKKAATASSSNSNSFGVGSGGGGGDSESVGHGAAVTGGGAGSPGFSAAGCFALTLYPAGMPCLGITFVEEMLTVLNSEDEVGDEDDDETEVDTERDVSVMDVNTAEPAAEDVKEDLGLQRLVLETCRGHLRALRTSTAAAGAGILVEVGGGDSTRGAFQDGPQDEADAARAGKAAAKRCTTLAPLLLQEVFRQLTEGNTSGAAKAAAAAAKTGNAKGSKGKGKSSSGGESGGGGDKGGKEKAGGRAGVLTESLAELAFSCFEECVCIAAHCSPHATTRCSRTGKALAAAYKALPDSNVAPAISSGVATATSVLGRHAAALVQTLTNLIADDQVKEAEIVCRILSVLTSLLRLESTALKAFAASLQVVCQEQRINSPVLAKAVISLYLQAHTSKKTTGDHIDTLRNLATEIRACVGLLSGEDSEGEENLCITFRVINNVTVVPISEVTLGFMESCIEESEYALRLLQKAAVARQARKAAQTPEGLSLGAAGARGMGARPSGTLSEDDLSSEGSVDRDCNSDSDSDAGGVRRDGASGERDPLDRRETLLCDRLQKLMKAMEMLVGSRLEYRSIEKLVSCASRIFRAITKVLKIRLTLKRAYVGAGLERVLESKKIFTKALQSLLPVLERETGAKVTKNHISRQSRLVPELIFQVEQCDAHLLKLGKLCKGSLDLPRWVTHRVDRDFQFNWESVAGCQEEMRASREKKRKPKSEKRKGKGPAAASKRNKKTPGVPQKNAEETEVASDGNDDGDENDDEGDWEREDEESEEEEEEGNEEDEDEQ